MFITTSTSGLWQYTSTAPTTADGTRHGTGDITRPTGTPGDLTTGTTTTATIPAGTLTTTPTTSTATFTGTTATTTSTITASANSRHRYSTGLPKATTGRPTHAPNRG